MAEIIDNTSLPCDVSPLSCDDTAPSCAVSALSWSPGSNFVHIALNPGKLRHVRLENCPSYLTCNECVVSVDPLCGWCNVEAKCSRVIDCQNSNMNGRYIENGQTGNCFDTVTVDPEEFITHLIVSGTFEVSIFY